MLGRLVAALIVFVPLAFVAWLALRRQPRPILWFALALCAVATGYLAATGATDDLARNLIGAARDAAMGNKVVAPAPLPGK